MAGFCCDRGVERQMSSRWDGRSRWTVRRRHCILEVRCVLRGCQSQRRIEAAKRSLCKPTYVETVTEKQQCNTSRASGFVDDVTFSHNGANRPKTTHMFRTLCQVTAPVGHQTTLFGGVRHLAAPGAKSAVVDCILFVKCFSLFTQMLQLRWAGTTSRNRKRRRGRQHGYMPTHLELTHYVLFHANLQLYRYILLPRG